MNVAVYQAGRRAGLTPSEAEAIAAYAVNPSVECAAVELGVRVQTLSNQLLSARRRLAVQHNAALVAKLLT